MNTLVENRKSQLMNIGFVLLLMGATTYFLLKDNDLPQLLSLIGSVNVGFLIIGLLVMVLFFTFEAGCIRTLMGSLKHEVSFLQCVRYSLIDFYFSSITPGC